MPKRGKKSQRRVPRPLNNNYAGVVECRRRFTVATVAPGLFSLPCPYVDCLGDFVSSGRTFVIKDFTVMLPPTTIPIFSFWQIQLGNPPTTTVRVMGPPRPYNTIKGHVVHCKPPVPEGVIAWDFTTISSGRAMVFFVGNANLASSDPYEIEVVTKAYLLYDKIA